jgi:hypothetical protein
MLSQWAGNVVGSFALDETSVSDAVGSPMPAIRDD